MLKKLLPILLALLVCAAAAAEDLPALVITGDMEFYSGPGTQYTQGAYHNTPPQPGEEATVLGRVTGADGQDWLFVRFTGHWFSQEHPAQYYLPASSAPEYADAPLLTFLAEPNALAAETCRVYADPEGTNYDAWISPNDAGLTVLDVQGDMAYIEAINPYGHPIRGYVSVRDLAQQPGVASLPDAPAGTAALAASRAIPLTHAPANNAVQALSLADGTLVLRYGTIPADAPWGEALAVIAPDGQLQANAIYRTHDGMEETTVEFLLASPEGFRVCRYEGDDRTPIREDHYTPDGAAVRTDVRRYAGSEPRPSMGTAHFTLSLGRADDADHTGIATIPLRVTASDGASIQLNISQNAAIPAIAECAGVLIVPVAAEDGQQLLVFSQDASLLQQIRMPGQLFLYDMQAAPAADGRIALLAQDGAENWQCWLLDVSGGTLTPGPAFTAPGNRRVTLLAADDAQLLVALSGVDTQILLAGAQGQQLAATLPGTVLYGQSDGSSTRLLMAEDGALRLETWAIALP
ncbi:MAG: hypothetical protein IJE07_11925 [Clostridia bacterium]|nr:hypothetical protein [Clostridia bacterium]